MEEKEFDVVNKAKHYNMKSIEVIDYIEDTMTPEMFEGFCIGNVLKYVSRYKHKNKEEDLKKAEYYLKKAITFIEKENSNNTNNKNGGQLRKLLVDLEVKEFFLKNTSDAKNTESMNNTNNKSCNCNPDEPCKNPTCVLYNTNL